MKSLIKTLIIFYQTLRTVLRVIFNFVRWCFTNRYTAALFSAVIVIIISWAIGFLLFVQNIDQTRAEILADNPVPGKTDAIVVLTGGSERLKHALFLLKLGYADKLFISGVNREVKLGELLYLHSYTDQQQEFKDRIELGYTAIDTIQNADEIRAWVIKNNINSIRLVTSNYHIKRAMLETQHKMPDIKIIPYGVVPLNIRIDKWWEFSSTRALLLSEYNKYLAANLRIFLEKLGLRN